MFPLCEDSITYTITTETFNHNQNYLKGTLDKSTIGSRIKHYRLLNDLTQEELAVKAGLDRSTIIRYENNQVDHSIVIINKIAAVLKILPSIIYDDYLKFIAANYGEIIKDIRKNLNLTQMELANLLGVHKKTVRKWEKMKSHPTRENYQKIVYFMP